MDEKIKKDLELLAIFSLITGVLLIIYFLTGGKV